MPEHTLSQTATLSSKKVEHNTSIPSSPMSSSAFTINGSTSSVLEPAGTYMIREVESGKAITLVNGRLTFESFVLRPREAGRYNLLVKDGHRLRLMAVAEVDKISPRLLLASNAKEGARWEFMEV
ncbi:hypothetical protein HD806DRAFT_536214 [Xylariaceae sp. AK1471]|nr:hypothetical protein HD806DRAFT_536214 [Xylariaceae sp. AK1471]